MHIVSHRGSSLSSTRPSHPCMCTCALCCGCSLHPVSFSSSFRCSSSGPSRCLPPSSTRGSSPKTCATSAWGPWPLQTTRHPSQEVQTRTSANGHTNCARSCLQGSEITALTWATQQRKNVVKNCVASQRNRLVPWITVFGEGADQEERIDEIADFVGKLYACLVSFTTDAANRIVRNSGEGNGLEAWRRYDPISSMRRVAILQQLQNPSRCQRVEDLGTALEDWALKETTGTDGPARHRMTALWRPCSG